MCKLCCDLLKLQRTISECRANIRRLAPWKHSGNLFEISQFRGDSVQVNERNKRENVVSSSNRSATKKHTILIKIHFSARRHLITVHENEKGNW
jgi:hypothetical protein